MTYCYSAYNFIIHSELLLPALPHFFSGSEAINPVVISYGYVDKKGLPSPTHQRFSYQANKTEFWLNVPSVARYSVSNGNSIIIDPVEGVDEDSIRVFLFHTCIEVLLKQRQVTVLPGYTLKFGDDGIAFSGSPRLGQSMLQGLWYKRGYVFLAGHSIALNEHGHALPGLAQIEFWPPVIETLKLEKHVQKNLRPNIKKCVIPLEQQYYPRPLPLKIIYILKTHQQTDVLFTKINDEHKLPHIQQLLAQNNVPADICYEMNTAEAKSSIQIIYIHLPAAGLKLQQLADDIEHDVSERGYSHAHI